MPVGVVSRQRLIRIAGETHGVGAGSGHVDSCAAWRDWKPHLSDSKLCRRSRKVTRMAEAVREALLRIKALGWTSTAADAARLHHLSDPYGFARHKDVKDRDGAEPEDRRQQARLVDRDCHGSFVRRAPAARSLWREPAGKVVVWPRVDQLFAPGGGGSSQTRRSRH